MNRWLVRICVLLILGAIVNSAVAWGFTWRGRDLLRWDSRSVTDAEHSRLKALGWSFSNFDGPYVPDFWIQRFRGWDQEDVVFYSYGARAICLKNVRAGWPMRALEGSRELSRLNWNLNGQSLTARDFVWHWSVPARTTFLYAGVSVPTDRILPLRPFWPGFAINTVFYAVVLWLLFAGPFVVRRWRRIRRGLCQKCAYDLRGSTASVCPECGATR